MFARYLHITLCAFSLIWNSIALAESIAHSTSHYCPDKLPEHALNLQEVTSMALCNNPQTRQMWANVQAQAAQTGISKSIELPSLTLNAGTHRDWQSNSSASNQRNWGLSASYLLYDFGARTASIENAYQLLVAANATRDSALQTIFLSAIQTFYQVQAASSAFSSAQISEQAAQQSFAAAQARYTAGSATPADKLSAQTAYSQAILNRITAAGALKKSQGALASVMGVDANQNISLIDSSKRGVPANFSENVDKLIEQAKLRRPDLQAVAAQLKAAQANVEAAKASGQPTISLTATTNHLANSGYDSNNSSLGLNVSVPIFSGYAPTYRIRAAEAQIDAKAAQLAQLRLQVALDVWSAYQNLATATQALQATADLLDSATQSERTALGRYKAGSGTILDVLNAQSMLANARQQSVQTNFDWNVSRAALALAVGNLDADLIITWSVSGSIQ